MTRPETTEEPVDLVDLLDRQRAVANPLAKCGAIDPEAESRKRAAFRLRRSRERAGWSKRRLAHELGISRRHLTDLEANNRDARKIQEDLPYEVAKQWVYLRTQEVHALRKAG